MKANQIMNSVTRTLHKVNFKFKKHSPEILVAAGVVGTVTSAVLACKATTKLSDILEESKNDIDEIHEYAETKGYSEKYTEQDNKKDLTIIYAQTGIKIVKLYAPAVILGTLSITGILAGHNITRKRYIASAAAYAAIDKSFKDYRGRVVERFGKELDHELRHNIKAKEIEEVTVDEKGKETVTKKTVNFIDPNTYSDYARFYEDGCKGWSKDAEYNLMFLKKQQAFANERLKEEGYLYLNEVYEMLGIPRSKAGQLVGWVYDKKNPVGDNFVDFGIYDLYNEKAHDFVNGYERTILLDFNVDGNILELM